MTIPLQGRFEDYIFSDYLATMTNPRDIEVAVWPQYDIFFTITAKRVRDLLLSHHGLRSLKLIGKDENRPLSVDGFHFRVSDLLPSIKEISLSNCVFNSRKHGLHINLDVANIQILTLDRCTRIDFLVSSFTLRGARLKEICIRFPIWREGEVNREKQHRTLRRFLGEQDRLEALELVAIGMPWQSLYLHANLKKLLIRDVEHQIRTTTPHDSFGRALAFKPEKASYTGYIAITCPKLEHLQMDLTLDNESRIDRLVRLHR